MRFSLPCTQYVSGKTLSRSLSNLVASAKNLFLFFLLHSSQLPEDRRKRGADPNCRSVSVHRVNGIIYKLVRKTNFTHLLLALSSSFPRRSLAPASDVCLCQGTRRAQRGKNSLLESTRKTLAGEFLREQQHHTQSANENH